MKVLYAVTKTLRRRWRSNLVFTHKILFNPPFYPINPSKDKQLLYRGWVVAHSVAKIPHGVFVNKLLTTFDHLNIIFFIVCAVYVTTN